MKNAAVAALLCLSGLMSARAMDTNGWASWSPRAEIAPRFSVDAKGGRQRGAALRLDSHESSEFGAWKKRMEQVQGGSMYRFSGWYRADRLGNERRSVITRLEWLDAQGKAIRPPDYALDAGREGKWTRVELITPAPTNATAAEVQVGMGFAPGGRVWWDEVELSPEPSPRDRVARVLTVYHRPRGTRSAAESLEQFCRLVETNASAGNRPDIICLPEGATVVGTGKSYAEVAEAVPGPSTARLGEMAKRLHSYVVAGLYERTGKVIYNTAVLVGRDGSVVGKYRKTHLPREEWEAGITPGDSYPVFNTDFGKVGVMICWDLQFPEPCRAMAAQGAELVLLPIWGGNDVLAQARAIENHIYLVSATYDMRSFVVDPAGKVLAEATKEHPVAQAELHLDRQVFQPWLGDMRTRTWKERRPDIAVP